MNLYGILSVDELALIEIVKVLQPSSTKYIIIDYLLNIKAYDRAFTILTAWTNILAKAHIV